MAYFAKIDENNIVTQVISVGEEFVEQFNADNPDWIETAKDDSIRYNYAGIGYTYNQVADAFTTPKPECGHKELTLNINNYRWECSNPEHEILNADNSTKNS